MMNDAGAAPLVPIEPNPFIVGNPVRDPAMFFGREAEFELIRGRFQQSEHGGLIVLCGERRSGKTSILFQAVSGRLGPDFIPVLIDMQSMVIANETGFLQRVMEEILLALGSRRAQLPLPALSTSVMPAKALYDFVGALTASFPACKLILLFDEYELFESKIDAGILTEDVLNVLAGIMERYGVFLIFTGSQDIEERRRRYWRILPKSIYRRISYLQRTDAVNLIQQPVAGRVAYDPDAIEAICRLTAGQPFYTQLICQNLIDHLNERRTNRATRSVVSAVVEAVVENPPPQMISLFDSLPADEKLALAHLAERLSGPDDQQPAVALARQARGSKYSTNLTSQRIGSALESLFGRELLDKGPGPDPGYAFRMDLWRLWIARRHSVWQVVREISSGRDPNLRSPHLSKLGRIAAVLLGGAALLVLGLLSFQNRRGIAPAFSSRSMSAKQSSSDTGRTAHVAATRTPLVYGHWVRWAQADSAYPARSGQGVVYDPGGHRMIAFGGGFQRRKWNDDVWQLALSQHGVWTRVHPLGTPPTATECIWPVQDSARNRLLTFGGADRSGVRHNETWALLLDGPPRWELLSPAGPYPPPRASHVAVLDPRRYRMIVFGGFDWAADKDVMNDVWSLSLAGGPRWIQLSPAGDPPWPRSDFAGDYDPVRDQIIYFGGNYRPDGSFHLQYTNEVWALSLHEPITWTQLHPSGPPPTPRKGHNFVFDAGNDRMILFGGQDSTGFCNDVWQLTLSGSPAWRQLDPHGPLPAPRQNAGMIYDPPDKVMVLSGGELDAQRFHETWALTLTPDQPAPASGQADTSRADSRAERRRP